MPELPEVETVVRGLQRAVPGRRILGVRLGNTDFIEDPSAIESTLPGSRIAAVRRHGKYIVFEMQPASETEPAAAYEARDGNRQPPFLLLVHLGMTGQIVVAAPSAPVAPHTHVFLPLDDGRELRYTDIRRFGKIRLVSPPRENAENAAAVGRTSDGGSKPAAKHPLAKLGLDPLEISAGQFAVLLRARNARIKAVLLDQSTLRGLGNIYSDEGLWRARIHPKRVAAELARAEVRLLYRAIRHVLRRAIRAGGSSISDYVNSAGEPGYFQLEHNVYRHEGKPCRRCGAKIRREIVAGRGSYFCPRCQRPRRTRARRGRRNARR